MAAKLLKNIDNFKIPAPDKYFKLEASNGIEIAALFK